MTHEAPRGNKMGTKPVSRLLFGMSVPIMGSMSVQALYNIVDGIFVSRIGDGALAAVSLVFPVQTLMIALATGIGVGINALLSMNLGCKDRLGAGRTARNGLFLSLLGFLAVATPGLALADGFMAMQTADKEIMRQGAVYMRIVCGCSFGLFLSVTFERLLQSAGRTVPSMFMQLLGAAINIIMDPVLIFGLGGFPCMGVAGAAVATVLGQTASLCLGLVLNLTMNRGISLNMAGFRPCARTVGRICSVGVPCIVVQVAGSVLTFALNRILLLFSPDAVAVYGAYCKLQNFVFMPIYGLSNSMVSIIAYNFGAGHRERMLQTAKLGFAAGAVIALCGALLFNVFPVQLLGWFNASGEMEGIGIVALRVMSLSFPFAGYCVIANAVFQALRKGVWSMCLSVARQFVVLFCAYGLAVLFGLDAMWWAFLVAESLFAFVAAVVLRKLLDRR